ncbi:hypothetical protein GX586_09950, partial [bacterium]|nr:hypothetical protein [bacterium]
MNASTRPLSLSSFDEAMRFLYRLRSFGTKLGLENVRFLLDKLGSPDSHGDYLHIAGTNGKGSTAAFLSSILREAGLKVGLFTSPHLLVFNERIQINGVPISDQAVLEHLNAILPVAARMEADGVHRYPTFFEVVTAIATLHFAAAGVDAVVWETGMGGRLDATNAVRTRASVITSVSLDHTAWLGGTIEKIAAEKAGIIRPATPVFTSVIDAQALKVILKTVVERQAPAVCIAPESEAGMFHAVVSEACGYYAYMIRYVPYEARRARSGNYSLSIQPLGLEALPLSLAGRHQVQNAALATAVGQWYLSSRRLLASLTESDLGEPMPETTSGLHGFSVDGPKYQSASVNPRSAIRKGLASAVWPGRFQVLRQKPLVVLDCAHNADAAL